MLAATGQPARAATTVYVDGAGVCAGLTPCFTTIQLGVKNAGPAPATVFVFPGTYAESVDLSVMGMAIAGMPGDITVGTVNAAGVPTDGTASVLPISGPAFRMSVAAFPGDVTIDGFIVQSPDSNGLTLKLGAHVLTLRGVVADGNANLGLSAVLANGSVSITGSSFSNNKNGDGINFGTVSEVEFEGVTADGNQGGGADFGISGPVHVRNSSFSNNKNGNGLSFGTATTVEFEGVTADGNQNDGANFGVHLTVHVRDSSFSNAVNGRGLSFGTATEVLFDGVTADGNQNDGANFGINGPVHVRNSSFSNAKNGEGINFGTADSVVFEGVTADGNQNDGANFGISGPVDVSNSSFSNAKNGDGIAFGIATSVNFVGVVVAGNSGDGLFTTLRSALIAGSRFVNNGGIGVALSVAEPRGLVRLRCNDIAGNQTGLRLDSTVTIDAERNWWGSALGPTTPANPGGTGDLIVDGHNGGFGTVSFNPFVTVPAGESRVCTPGAPLLDSSGLVVLLLGLFVLPAWRLAGRATSA